MNGLEQFYKQPISIKIALLAFLLIIIGVVEFQMFYVPLNEELKNLESQTNKLRVELAESQAIADNLPRFREEVAILNEELKRALELLPDQADVQGLYRQLSNEAKKTNVDLIQFRPSGKSDHGFYSGLNMDIQFKGTFHDIAIFIDQIGKLNRIVNISNLNFAQVIRLENSKVELEVSAKATTFMFSGGKG